MSTKKSKKSAPVVELSRDQLIQKALLDHFRFYIRGNGDDLAVVPKVPDSRKLVLGDEVTVGNLKNCVVIYVTPDYRFVVIQNDDGIGAWAWLDVFKTSDMTTKVLIEDNQSYLDRLFSVQIDSILNKVFKNGVDDTPAYQRDYVWTLSDKIRFIESVFAGNDLGKIIFLKYDYPRTDYEVLDGKQRLNALVEYVTSQFQVHGLYWHQLRKLDRMRFEDRTLQIAELDGNRLSEADKIRLFLQVNVAGVPQSEEHIASVKEKLKELEKSA